MKIFKFILFLIGLAVLAAFIYVGYAIYKGIINL